MFLFKLFECIFYIITVGKTFMSPITRRPSKVETEKKKKKVVWQKNFHL